MKLKNLAPLALGACVAFSMGLPVAAKTKLTWAMWGTAVEGKYWKSLTADFEKENPDIEVDLTVTDWSSYHTKLLALISAGLTPDVMLVDGYYFPRFAGAKVLKPVDAFVKQDKYDMGRFYKAALLDIVYGGNTYGLPWGFGPHVQYYNGTLFKTNGLEDPYALQQKGQWTWDTFLNAAKKLTKDTNGDGKPDQSGVTASLAHPWISPWLWSNGGGVLDATKTKVTLDSTATLEAIQWQYALEKTHRVAGVGGAFESGKLGVTTHWFTGAMWWKPLLKKFDWNVVPYPAGKAGQYTILKGNVNAMSAACKNPKAAWKLIKFAASEKFESGLFATGFWWSANRAFNQSDTVREAIPGLHTDVFDDCSGKYAHLLPIVKNYQRMEEVINEGFTRFAAGKGDAKQIFGPVAKQVAQITGAK